MSDTELVKKCIEGKTWAFGVLYKRFRGHVINMIKHTALLQRVSLSGEDFEDCEQFVWESFLRKDYNMLRRWEARCSLARWIKVCSGNAAINFFKAKRKISLYEIGVDEFFPSLLNKEENISDPNQDIERIDNEKILDKVKYIVENDLNERERLFVQLYWHEGLPNEELVVIMNLSKENLHLMKYRITKKVRNALEQ